MKKTILVTLFVLAALVSLIAWLMIRDVSPSVSVTTSEEARFIDATKIAYTSVSGDISVEYVGDLARITGGMYDRVILRQVTAPSGARYEGGQGLSLWVKGDEVRIETPQQVVYSGVAVAPVVTEEIPVEIPADTATTTATSSAIAYRDIVWVWESAKVGEETITPKAEGKFSITFVSDGSLRGTTDCNSFGSEYTAESGVVTLSAFRMTEMFCADSEESVFTDLLVGSLSVLEKTDSTLVLQNSSQAEIQFVRN